MKQIPNPSILLVLLLNLLINGFSSAQTSKTLSPDLATLASKPKTVVNRTAMMLVEGKRKGIRIDERAGEGLVWIPGMRLADGILEFDVRGRDSLKQFFVGIAFHGQDDKTYEAIYFRPFNFHSADPLRRVHAVQYIAHPTYTWEKLRAEFPGRYEAALTPPPDANHWFHVRVEIQSLSVRVFVNHNATPALVVNRLVQTANGQVGLWVGNESGGDFAHLTVLPAR
ncbi:hypothetical protein [Spirosoma linguale]|uniref:3-keto-disaccharide hydrolase domain-containing protein n=1 Tax=Spirosoma linguale (strain ATCC 33905 / DSM 74 / LMG 10896 / Claus 1) TaxID=504472 RepID=D2QR92_SPILD|nr:conserved hypothetical protein [Spirosoma linguale DSM 74]